MIHPTALISPETTLWENVTIWPYVVLEWACVIWDNATIMSHVWISNSSLGEWSTLVPFAKIEKSQIWERCKIWCELRKCVLGDRVQASHTNIVLEWTTIAWYTNIASWTVFAWRWGQYTDDGTWYIKWTLHIWTNVFVWLNTSFLPGKDQTITIWNDVYIAWNISLRHDVPDGHTVYPSSLVDHLISKWATFDILKRSESYCILTWNKMKDDGILKFW